MEREIAFNGLNEALKEIEERIQTCSKFGDILPNDKDYKSYEKTYSKFKKDLRASLEEFISGELKYGLNAIIHKAYEDGFNAGMDYAHHNTKCVFKLTKL